MFTEIVIRLLGVLAGYFIVGALVMKFKFQATGTDIIPNKGFWFVLPFLVKVYNYDNYTYAMYTVTCHILQDGFLFTFSPCVSAVKNRGYNKA